MSYGSDRVCLVCSSTVGATNFSAPGKHFELYRIPWDSIPDDSTETAENRH